MSVPMPSPSRLGSTSPKRMNALAGRAGHPGHDRRVGDEVVAVVGALEHGVGLVRMSSLTSTGPRQKPVGWSASMRVIRSASAGASSTVSVARW